MNERIKEIMIVVLAQVLFLILYMLANVYVFKGALGLFPGLLPLVAIGLAFRKKRIKTT